jgi:hypothetical protein
MADPAAADRLADAATELARGGRLAEAAQQFRQAFAEDPRPGLMCNAAISYFKAKDLVHAQRYLERCIGFGASLDRAFIDNLREVLKAVEADLRSTKLTPVEITAEPKAASIAIAGSTDEPFTGPSRIWLSSGPHELVVTADGYVERRVAVTITDMALEPLRITLEPVAVKVPPVVVHQEPSEAADRPSIRPALIASIATGALGIAAVVSYVIARDRARASDFTDPNLTLTHYDELVDSAHAWQHASWGLGIAAGIGAAVSSYLLLSAPAGVEINASGNGAAVSLTGSW